MNISRIYHFNERVFSCSLKTNFKFKICSYNYYGIRCYSRVELPSICSQWQINKFGNTDELSLINDIALPIVKHRNDVLIKVHASSVNPIDTRMLQGYGNEIISKMRCINGICKNQNKDTFPLILGRDFSGTIVHSVGQKNYKIGDEVFGALHPFNSGAHAEYIVANVDEFIKKPVSLTHQEAATLPYVVMTTHSALWGLNKHSFVGKRVLILGASGGIGTYATQLLSSWKANVIAVCSSDSHEMISQLGALECRDYHDEDYAKDLKNSCDFILDAVDRTKLTQFDWTSLLSPGGRYITLDTPLLKETDDKGLLCGFIKSGIKLGNLFSQGLPKGKLYSWGFFKTNNEALLIAKELIDSGSIKPVIDSVYEYSNLPEAYENLIEGHKRGKTVISIIE